MAKKATAKKAGKSASAARGKGARSTDRAKSRPPRIVKGSRAVTKNKRAGKASAAAPAAKRPTAKPAAKVAKPAAKRKPAVDAHPLERAAGRLGASPTRDAAAVVRAAGSSRPKHLTAREIEQFRQMLLDKRRQLLGDVGGLQKEALNSNRDASGNLSNMPIHMADVGSDHYEQELTLGLIEGERALLSEINQALERIEKGTYGICEATGQPINKARLNATPWTKYSYEYMLAQESRHHRRL